MDTLFPLYVFVLFALYIGHVVAVENFVTAEVMFSLYDDTIKVPYEGVSQTLIYFEQKGIVDFRPILLDDKHNQVIVGARDHVFRLNEQSLAPLEKFEWLASSDSVEACLMRWSDKFDCRNFIRMLIMKDDSSLLICGTNAFSPACMWRNANGLSASVQDPFNGIGYVPFSPRYDHTYLFSRENHLYTGVGIDTSGDDSSFLRMMPDGLFLRIEKANSLSLNEPVFVAAFDVDPFVYFFFRETAMEVLSSGKVTYARIARVCKNDIGGTIRLHGYWTTFTKARLVCGVSESDSLNFVRAVEYVEEEQSFYAIFTSSE
ncbi:unnamed protein product [Soboliphyme baturini]|uniref:Sema domain-containing protein n=1 Tax=Soboliphyme baturini TaxID=241478 RepID=A0A183IW71_9BILA|nr:unnamed protein product [Soboliphyme baturini]